MKDPAPVVELSVRLEAHPDEVFGFLTDAGPLHQVAGREGRARPASRGRLSRLDGRRNRRERASTWRSFRHTALVFTWGWEGNPDVPPGSTTVELSLVAEGDGTVLSLRHTGLPTGEAAAIHEEGWRFFTGSPVHNRPGRRSGPDARSASELTDPFAPARDAGIG